MDRRKLTAADRHYYRGGRGYADKFISRVEADGGIVEAEDCLRSRIETLESLGMMSLASAVWLPHGYKEGKLYAAKGGANADLGFTRGGTRTRKGPTYVEQVPYNLLQYSEQFDNGVWGKTNSADASVPVVTANYSANPIDGAMTADRIVLGITATAGSYSVVNQQNPNLPITGTYTFSVWLKTNNAATIQVSLRIGGGNGILKTVTPDWQRLSITVAPNTSCTVDIMLFQSAGTSTTADLSAYGAQLRVGSSVGDYFRTTNRQNVPALDYTGSTCPALSLDKASTNLCLQSEDYTNASWTKTDTTPTGNNVAGPDNLTTADLLTEGTAGTAEVSQAATITADATYSKSVWVKRGNTDWVCLNIYNSTNGIRAWFNLATGAKGSVANFGTGTGATADIKDYGNGWYRCTLTGAVNNSVTSATFSTHSASADASTTRVASSTRYQVGHQFEAGSYATSYIPTTTATVSRVADAVTAKTGFSDYIGQTEGTLYFEGSTFADGTQKVISISDGTSNNRIILEFNTANTLSSTLIAGGSILGSISYGAFTTGTNYKIAVVYRNNYFALFVNGAKVGEDLTITVPACSQVRFDHGGSTGGGFYGAVKARSLCKTAISDAEAISLTT